MRPSWIPLTSESDFTLENLPIGAFLWNNDSQLGVPLGDQIINLKSLWHLGYIKDIFNHPECLTQTDINSYIALDKSVHRALRARLQELFSPESTLHNNVDHHAACLIPSDKIVSLLPVKVGDYVDFYASKEHASNVGRMFRDEKNPLLPNWLHLPIGYHGRASSIGVSGTPVQRPCGQIRTKENDFPIFTASRELDFELEVALISRMNTQGKSLSVAEAEDALFGVALFNDWSARDIQRWEYVPLGPFLGKSFACSLSPWIVSLDALESFRVPGPTPDLPCLPYLQASRPGHYNITLEVWLKTSKSHVPELITQTNMKHLYWNPFQLLAHLTSNGSPLRAGDLCGTGTVSGSAPNSLGSLLELSWNSQRPLKLLDGKTRSFLEDGDEVIMKGYAQDAHSRIGLGEVRGTILPARDL